MIYKKAISPVVAVALLLVVSVVAVVGFQQWYSGYQSVLTTDVEQRSSNAAGDVNVEFISSDGIIYITNTGTDNVSMSTIKIGDTDCSINQNLEPGVNNISVASCLNNTGTNEVILVTDSGIIQESLFVEEISASSGSSSLDCSSLNGGEWILVPGNPTLGTSDFCVMKYEAKATTTSEVNLFSSGAKNCGDGTDGGGNNCPIDGSVNITSKPEENPITNVYQTEARVLCSNLGPGYHLITNAEWTTIARNAELVTSNWIDNVIGSTVASGGGFKRGNVGVDDSASYNAAVDPADRSLDTNPKSMLTLSNSEVIWDLSGNVMEWNNDTCLQNSPWYTSGIIEWTDSNINTTEKDLAGPIGNYTLNEGVGRYYGCTADGKGFVRGGGWTHTIHAGNFYLRLDTDPLFSHWLYGFRCAYTP